MARPRLTLYYDIHSPYSYLAFHVIKNSPVFKCCDITYIPVLLVAFIKLTGLKPPWDSPNKVNWMATDLKRWCRDFSIPWREGWPANYPFKATTLKVQRMLAACSLECPAQYPEVIGALYEAFWREKKGVQLPETYEPIVADVLGAENASRVFVRSSTDEIKDVLKRNTQNAFASGAPGVPWIHAVNAQGKEEWYWGFDHLGQAARFLELENLGGSPGPHL